MWCGVVYRNSEKGKPEKLSIYCIYYLLVCLPDGAAQKARSGENENSLSLPSFVLNKYDKSFV